jgi:hypothetical protein
VNDPDRLRQFEMWFAEALGDRSVSDAAKVARSRAKKKGHLLAFCEAL